jgi:hypothetical protein
VDSLIPRGRKEGRTRRIRRDGRIKPSWRGGDEKGNLAKMSLESVENPREGELRGRKWSGVWSDPSCCNQGAQKAWKEKQSGECMSG